MASVSITRRRTKEGRPRWVVRYRLGGRYTPPVHGGSFRTEREARIRRDLISGEIAACRNPADVLGRLAAAPARRPTMAELAIRYRASRLDAAEETLKNMDSHLRRILPAFGQREPQEIGGADVQEWVAEIAAELMPSSVRRYMATLRLLLDFAGVDPNPARDPRVKLSSIVREEPIPPTDRQLLAILDAATARRLLGLITQEQTAMRSAELSSLAWGDVDLAESRFRLRGGETKTGRPRWVQVPAWLMEEIAASCPIEDRSAQRRVFPGLSPDVLKNVMATRLDHDQGGVR